MSKARKHAKELSDWEFSKPYCLGYNPCSNELCEQRMGPIAKINSRGDVLVLQTALTEDEALGLAHWILDVYNEDLSND